MLDAELWPEFKSARVAPPPAVVASVTAAVPDGAPSSRSQAALMGVPPKRPSEAASSTGWMPLEMPKARPASGASGGQREGAGDLPRVVCAAQMAYLTGWAWRTVCIAGMRVAGPAGGEAGNAYRWQWQVRYCAVLTGNTNCKMYR